VTEFGKMMLIVYSYFLISSVSTKVFLVEKSNKSVLIETSEPNGKGETDKRKTENDFQDVYITDSDSGEPCLYSYESSYYSPYKISYYSSYESSEEVVKCEDNITPTQAPTPNKKIPWLTPTPIPWLTPTPIPWLTSTPIPWLTSTTIPWLTPTPIPWLTPTSTWPRPGVEHNQRLAEIPLCSTPVF
jgi:hypothetical protein